jgi:STE24 endopeptidase
LNVLVLNFATLSEVSTPPIKHNGKAADRLTSFPPHPRKSTHVNASETAGEPQAPSTSAAAAGEGSFGMSPEELAETQHYGRVELRLSLVDMALDAAFLALAAFVLARPLDGWLQQFSGLGGEHSIPRLLALYGIVFLLHVCVSLPLSFYSGYIVEHRFGLSNQTVARWVRNWLLGNAFALVLGGVLFAGLYWMIWNTGAYWWLIAAAAFFLVSVVLGQLAPVLFLPLFYKIERIDREDLLGLLRRLAEGTGLAIEGVYRMGMSADTKKANAMLAGLGRTRRVLMGDTLLDQFSPEEIEIIFAHEIGHHVHRHIPKMIATGAAISVLGFWVVDRVLIGWSGVASASEAPTWSLPLVMFSLMAFQLLLGPLQNAISRHYERQCDRFALVRTGNRAAYTTAFTKLARLNKADPQPHPVEVFLMHSHPPIAERLAMAHSA